MAGRRALHYVLKVGDRHKMMDFLKNDLKMTVLRHEEFDSGCPATCNGPYNNLWSKTMIGYGPEDKNFVLEITYNYPVDKYTLGNDVQGITVQSSTAFETCQEKGILQQDPNGCHFVISPAHYKFYLEKGQDNKITQVTLSVSDLKRSLAFWRDLLAMPVVKGDCQNWVLLNYGGGEEKKSQAGLLLKKCEKVDRATAFGRVAFALPTVDLEPLENKVKASGGQINTPYTKLDTPGKAPVVVVILADPDQHEICFVGEEGFGQLSQVDPEADNLLQKALETDKSNEWFAKKKMTKESAK